MTVYFHFLNLSVEHAFFRDGRCRNLNFVPSHGTRRLFENSDLLIRQTGNGVSPKRSPLWSIGTLPIRWPRN